jgi:hypothetical protein
MSEESWRKASEGKRLKKVPPARPSGFDLVTACPVESYKPYDHEAPNE